MTKAIVAKLERFLDAAVAKLDPPSTHVMWVPPQPAGWTVEAARATGEELWACQGRAVREADLLTFVTWLPPRGAHPRSSISRRCGRDCSVHRRSRDAPPSAAYRRITAPPAHRLTSRRCCALRHRPRVSHHIPAPYIEYLMPGLIGPPISGQRSDAVGRAGHPLGSWFGPAASANGIPDSLSGELHWPAPNPPSCRLLRRRMRG
jgi:hypothetical protein